MKGARTILNGIAAILCLIAALSTQSVGLYIAAFLWAVATGISVGEWLIDEEGPLW